MTELTLETLRAELEPIRTQLAKVSAQVDGLPLIGRKLSAIQQDLRMLKTAFNDFALTSVTAGEIEALHDDVNKVMTKELELETRIVTLERLVDEKRS